MQYIVYPDGEKIVYGYDDGGQVVSVTGEHFNEKFCYVRDIGYDEYGQRLYIDYGNGVHTDYNYNKERRWLDSIGTKNKWGVILQNISYSFDRVGNVSGYTNVCTGEVNGSYSTRQSYSYDGLYQLVLAEGETVYNPHKSVNPEFKSYYRQEFTFDASGIGNMISKKSSETVMPSKKIGDDLNYNFDYVYDDNFAHRLVSIGNRYYQYDLNGNVTVEQDGSFDENAAVYGRAVDVDGNGVKSTDYGWGLFKDSKSASESEQYKRVYTWDEKNRLIASSDSTYTVSYLYSQDGERTNKYTLTSETLYFSKMWSCHTDAGNSTEGGQTSKHIYLGETRIVTKLNSGTNPTYSEEYNRQYYYHADHLGSAHLITDKDGNEYQRLEYTPYGEIWVEKTSNTGLEYLPYKFTGKEMDSETGLYYYGARYLDPKYSRWLSTDPALGDYIPQAPISDKAKKHNQNLPGMGGVFNQLNSNLYHYAGNNPVRYVDPDGEITITPNMLRAAAWGIRIGTVIEDAATFGAGVADDIPTLAFAESLMITATLMEVANNAESQVANNLKSNAQSPTTAAGSPAPNGNNNDDDYYESSPKHNQNSKSPEPKNAKEMFDKSVKDPEKTNTRWYKDKNGEWHRFQGQNHKYHWNGSTDT